MKGLRAHDAGFTLFELVMAIVIMGIITVPLGNFVLAYFDNYATTENRLSDSHDIQIATAYFGADVANAGLYANASPYAPIQSVWSTAFPAGSCGQGLGTTKLLLEWYKSASTISGGAATAGAAYVVEGSTLHRIYCEDNGAGMAVKSDATVVHNLVSAAPGCFNTTGASTSCDAATSPPRVRLTLGISSGSTDSAAPEQPVTLDGQRRQS